MAPITARYNRMICRAAIDRSYTVSPWSRPCCIVAGDMPPATCMCFSRVASERVLSRRARAMPRVSSTVVCGWRRPRWCVVCVSVLRARVLPQLGGGALELARFGVSMNEYRMTMTYEWICCRVLCALSVFYDSE